MTTPDTDNKSETVRLGHGYPCPSCKGMTMTREQPCDWCAGGQRYETTADAADNNYPMCSPFGQDVDALTAALAHAELIRRPCERVSGECGYFEPNEKAWCSRCKRMAYFDVHVEGYLTTLADEVLRLRGTELQDVDCGDEPDYTAGNGLPTTTIDCAGSCLTQSVMDALLMWLRSQEHNCVDIHLRRVSLSAVPTKITVEFEG